MSTASSTPSGKVSERGISSAGTDPLIGRTLAEKYIIRRVIARGGVGIVYLATRLETGKNVVVKFLAENWVGDAEAVARFEREAKRLNSLRHPNIVAMLDYGHTDGRAFLVMEYVPGELLGHYVGRRGKLTVDEFVPIAAQILKGLGDAHSREMMIRDIKASNIMLCEYMGRGNFVKILDFGLAKRLRGETQITEEHVLGTVGYLAPEALQGQAADLRIDVYAIGVLFYYMLTGVMPFEGDNNAAVFYKTINEAPRDLREHLSPGHNVPSGLIDLIHCCLEKDREKRPADANAIVEAMIDVIPGSMFRLPRVGMSSSEWAMAPSSSESAGMIDMAGFDPSAPHATIPRGSASALTGSTPVVEAPKQRRWVVVSLAAVALVATTTAIAVIALPRNDRPAVSTNAAVVAPNTPTESAPVREPGTVTPPPTSAPAPTPSVAPEPTAPGEQPPVPVATGPVSFDARPAAANVYVDGVLQGTTPFTGELPVGRHSIRMTAWGYHPWESTYDVAADGNAPVDVRLVGTAAPKRDRRSSGNEVAASTATPPATVPTTPAPPASGLVPASTKSDERPFLSADSRGDTSSERVFLPANENRPSGDSSGGLLDQSP
jgi:serine/threonine protein kinase